MLQISLNKLTRLFAALYLQQAHTNPKTISDMQWLLTITYKINSNTRQTSLGFSLAFIELHCTFCGLQLCFLSYPFTHLVTTSDVFWDHLGEFWTQPGNHWLWGILTFEMWIVQKIAISNPCLTLCKETVLFQNGMCSFQHVQTPRCIHTVTNVLHSVHSTTCTHLPMSSIILTVFPGAAQTTKMAKIPTCYRSMILLHIKHTTSSFP